MPSHPPRSQPFKKTELLAKRERSLIKALKNQDSISKIRNLAELVREAKLAILKGTIASNQNFKAEDGPRYPSASALNSEKQWETMTADDVISLYKGVA